MVGWLVGWLLGCLVVVVIVMFLVVAAFLAIALHCSIAICGVLEDTVDLCRLSMHST